VNFINPDLSLLRVEWVLLSGACLALIVDLFAGKKWPFASYLLVQIALLVGVVLSFMHLHDPKVVSFSHLYVSDIMGRILQSFILLIAFAAFIYSRHYVIRRHIAHGEYYVLGLFATVGMLVLVAAHSLLTIYLGLELLSLPLYAMVALQRDLPRASEAAMKYFVMGAIASAMMLYGMSMIYGATGSLDFSVIAEKIAALPQAQTPLLSFALVFIIVAIGFKLAAAPFHMWAPDVYSGAPTSVTLFLASAPKLAAFGMAARLLLMALPQMHIAWQQILMVMAILSMGFGNLLAIAQSNIKRMLAYSAIAHMGYMLLGFVAGSLQAYSASLFYILVYGLMSLGAFGILVLLSHSGFEVEKIEDLQGLNSQNPWFAFLMLIIMFSMAGVPPTVGFFAKLFVLKSLVDAHMVWLAALALGFAIIGVFYYLRIVKVMYFEKPKEARIFQCPLDMQLVFSANSLALLALGLFPGALLEVCRMAFAA